MPIRAMTVPEKNLYQAIFPAMDVDRQPRVTGEVTPFPPPPPAVPPYNCIAWTVGITNQWIEPFQSLPEWIDFYHHHGYDLDDDGGEIALWRNGPEYTHGSRVSTSAEFPWESKCGQLLRLLHDQDELVGLGPDDYGNVFTYFRRTEGDETAARIRVSRSKMLTMLSAEHIDRARAIAARVEPSLRAAFQEQFKAWQETWGAGRVAMSSRARDRASGFSYRSLVMMGPDILPLVVEELLDPNNFIANQLYYELQSDPKLCRRTPMAEEAFLSEQERSKLIVVSYVESRK